MVAIPRGLARNEVLDLASLVLTGREYAELQNRIQPATGPGPGRAPGSASPS